MNQLKIFIITQDEPFYIPKMIKKLISAQGRYQIVGYTILKPHRKNKNMLHWFQERSILYSFWELVLVSIAYLIVKLLSFFGLTSKYSNSKLLSDHNIEEYPSKDINDKNYLELLKMLKLDYIISISSPQLFQAEILELPKVACLNAHGTLLPRHRGVFGSWWTLFCGDEIGGSTIHTMELKLDAGYIIWQKSFSLTPNDTQYSVAFKTKKDMTSGLIEIFNNTNNSIPYILKPVYSSSYHRAPTREQGIEFHKMGKRVITLKDLKNIFFGEYV